eukprot:SAG31_NODE_45738_length_257_cov_1.240506_1_plen_69_part_10
MLPLDDESVQRALAEKVSCPCETASLCDPVAVEHEKEVFGFTAGDDWDKLDWTQVTTIAWSDDPQLVCT